MGRGGGAAGAEGECVEPAGPRLLPRLGQQTLQLVTDRPWSGARVAGPVLLLGGGGGDPVHADS